MLKITGNSVEQRETREPSFWRSEFLPQSEGKGNENPVLPSDYTCIFTDEASSSLLSINLGGPEIEATDVKGEV